jgi:hypothetical protein
MNDLLLIDMGSKPPTIKFQGRCLAIIQNALVTALSALNRYEAFKENKVGSS